MINQITIIFIFLAFIFGSTYKLNEKHEYIYSQGKIPSFIIKAHTEVTLKLKSSQLIPETNLTSFALIQNSQSLFL